MALACILLDRTAIFRLHPEEISFRERKRANGWVVAEPLKDLVGATTPELPELPEIPSREEIEASVAKYLEAMTPDLEFVEPPEVSRITMQRPQPSTQQIQDCAHVLGDTAVAAAADKNLVVLHAAPCRPSFSYNRWYLLLDLDAGASSSTSLSEIPGIPIEYSNKFRSTGYGTVIMAREGGDFVLADLRVDFLYRRGLPGLGLLCIWQSSLCSWVYKCGELPDQVTRTWRSHVSFPVRSRNRNLFCWVDLQQGLLLWDLEEHEVDSPWLDLTFVPLPHGCSVSDGHRRWSYPQEYRNMACVDGAIKFLNMDGFVNRGPITLVTYFLNLDKPSPEWMVDTKMLLEDLWKDKTFISKDVPRIRPMFPILSTLKHDVVYLVIPGDEELVEGFRFRGVKRLLSIDVCKTKVISATEPKRPRALETWRYLLAASVSQWGSKYHQEAVEPIGMGTSGKRVKLE